MGKPVQVFLSALVASVLTRDTGKLMKATLTADGVKADVHMLIAAFNAHDAAKTVSHDTPDFVGKFHGMANNLGPAADLSITKLQVADPKAHIDLSNETVDVSKGGDIAVYRAAYAATSTDPKANRAVVRARQPVDRLSRRAGQDAQDFLGQFLGHAGAVVDFLFRSAVSRQPSG